MPRLRPSRRLPADHAGTHAILEAARALYARAGYRIIESGPFTGFGKELTNEIWQLDL